ncbi:hypothetical protein HanXRQr2_Chr02g0086031 [Helianthus annuus]|uniref:Uncharacterized protein n=1 Tax=Helianthus annuus TaxID=4232 RepID=A0A9K3JS45_HELAN|nr:hypothetical protein HanXRQr2_Chr02g0086031 [Helianthus annuus]
MSCDTLMASNDAPDRPLLVNPTAYTPHFPFHPSGNDVVGIPSFENKSLSCPHEGTLLQYPVAKITESISRFLPSTSSTHPLENFLIPGTI